MRAIRVRALKKIALKNHQKVCNYYDKKIPFKTFFRWIKRMYNDGTLRYV
jgi:hypothetical protein